MVVDRLAEWKESVEEHVVDGDQMSGDVMKNGTQWSHLLAKILVKACMNIKNTRFFFPHHNYVVFQVTKFQRINSYFT